MSKFSQRFNSCGAREHLEGKSEPTRLQPHLYTCPQQYKFCNARVQNTGKRMPHQSHDQSSPTMALSRTPTQTTMRHAKTKPSTDQSKQWRCMWECRLPQQPTSKHRAQNGMQHANGEVQRRPPHADIGPTLPKGGLGFTNLCLKITGAARKSRS